MPGGESFCYTVLRREAWNMSEKKTKPKYSLFSNVAYMVRLALNGHRGVLWLCLIIAFFTVGKTAAEMMVAPAILAIIEGGEGLTVLLTAVCGFTLLLVFLNGGKAYFEENTFFGRTTVRSDIVVALDMKRAMTSYPNLLDTRFRESSNQAGVAVNGDSGATESIWNTLTELLANTLGFSLYLVLLSGLNIWLAAVTTVMTVLGFLVNLRLSRWGYAHREERAKFVNALSYSTNLLLERNYAKDIRIFGITDWVQEVWAKNLKLFRSFAEKNQRHLFWGNLLDAVLALLRNGLAYFVLVSMVLRQEITVSEFLLYFSAVSGFTAWVTGILDGVFTLHRQCLDISKVREFLDWKEPFRFESGTELPEKPYEFRFENVSYRYPGAKEDTIKNLDLTIHSGEKLAIVGLNGAGKTTLIKLLAGFLDPNEGRVLLNGTDIREFDRRKYYELFSAVFQDFSVLPATIRENVTQSLDKPDIERLWRALELAGLSSKVKSLPSELETQVTRDVYEDGTELSGGETQRLMLARVIYRNSPVILLDEPTAALDPIAENEIYLRYNEITEGNSSVFISHRLASTRFCDRILYLEDGGIAEEGTHDELMSAGGKYAELFEVQSKYYSEETVENE